MKKLPVEPVSIEPLQIKAILTEETRGCKRHIAGLEVFHADVGGARPTPHHVGGQPRGYLGHVGVCLENQPLAISAV